MNEVVALVVGLFVGVVYVLMVGFLVLQQRRRRDVAVKLRRAALSVLRRKSDPDEAARELEIICINLAKEGSSSTGDHKSAVDLLEQLYYTHETEPRMSGRLENWFGAERLEDTQLETLTKVIDLMREKRPFASVSGSCGSLLDSLKKLLDPQNTDAGRRPSQKALR